MRRLGLLACALGLIFAFVTPVQASIEDLLFDLAIFPLDGTPASNFKLESLDGKQTSLKNFKGKVVLLYFWRTT